MSSALPGIEPQVLGDWLAAQLPDFPPPYDFRLVGAGGSNLTYIVTAGNGEVFVLRRPPLRARLATAHDMQRETRLLRALAGSAVPVPRVLASCESSDVIGAGFYGSTTALRLAEYDIFETVVLTDVVDGKAEGLALDMNQSRWIDRSS